MKMQKFDIFVTKIENEYLKDKKYHKVRDHFHYPGEYRGPAHSICNLKYSLPKKISIVFHIGSNYDYLFTIKQYLFTIKDCAEEFKNQFAGLGENTEKYITFLVTYFRESVPVHCTSNLYLNECLLFEDFVAS